MVALRHGLAAVVLFTCATAAQELAKEPELAATLNAESFPEWRDHIRTTANERDWAQLPWLMTFRDGLVAAGKAKKPLLLWTMNGHPFGCT